MGNALVFVCPRCGREAQMSVTQTYVPAVVIKLGGGSSNLTGRTRQRYCGICRSHFDTSEISVDSLNYLLARDQLSMTLIDRFQTAFGSVSIGDPIRVKSIKCIHLLCDVFGTKFHPSWESVYPLSISECNLIIEVVGDAIDSIDDECAIAIKNYYELNSGDRAKFVSEDQGKLNRGLRQFKHPSRSLNLGRLVPVIWGGT